MAKSTLHQLNVICEGAPVPGRVNEDAAYLAVNDETVTLLAVDGATPRLPAHALTLLLAAWPEQPMTPAGHAARVARVTVACTPHLALRDRLLAANAELRQQLVDVYGALTPDTVIGQEPHVRDIGSDPRLFRLVLPACVATLAEVDLAARHLTYAHAGDTALFVWYADGRIDKVPSADLAGREGEFLARAWAMQDRPPDGSFVQPMRGEDLVLADKLTGIFHNYVDEHGSTDPALGVAVINGLPQLDAYLMSGEFDLTGATGVLVCSDGLLWPAERNAPPDDAVRRWAFMRDTIQHDGLTGYYRQLRELEASDPRCQRFPRFKVHDDATGLYLRL